MFSLNDSMKYWLYSQPTDMRKSYYTLSGIVSNSMGLDPCNGDVYIFMNKSRNRIKLLHWEPGGLVIYSKLLEDGTFGSPSNIQEDEMAGCWAHASRKWVDALDENQAHASHAINIIASLYAI